MELYSYLDYDYFHFDQYSVRMGYVKLYWRNFVNLCTYISFLLVYIAYYNWNLEL